MSVSPRTDQSLSAVFDVELTKTDKPLAELQITAKVESIDSVDTQREYVKANLVELIEKGKIALENLIQIAASTEKSRDFEVMSTMIKTLVDTNMTLLECEVKQKESKANDGDSDTPTTVNNTAVFVGQTADLASHFKNVVLQQQGK